MKIESCGISDIGRRRPRNEDRFLADDRLGLYLVCDGMGGHAGGDVAAEATANAVAEYFRDRSALIQRMRDSQNGQALARQLIAEAVQQAHQRVRTAASQTPGLYGMGTTLTMLLVLGRRAVSAHVGDSRIYRIREGEVEQLTRDHTLAGSFDGYDTKGLEDLLRRYRHALLSWVGSRDAIKPDIQDVDLQEGDCLVLCTDGLSKYLDDPQALSDLVCLRSPSRSTRDLIHWANDRGGSDNITAIVLRCHENSVVAEPGSTVVQSHRTSDSSASYCFSLR